MGAKIDSELLKMKAHYFLSHSAVSPIVPYITTYARQLGFSSVAVGMTAANLTLCSFILKPIFGYVGDRFHMRKTLVLILLMVVATSLMATNFIKPLEPVVAFDRRCATADGDVLEYCPQFDMREGCLIQQVLTQRSNIDQHMQCWINCFHRDNDITNTTNGKRVLLDIDLTQTNEVGACLHFKVANATSSYCTEANATLPLRCSGTCSDPNVMAVLGNNREDTERYDTWSAQLWIFVVCITLASVGIVGTATVSNAMCFALLGDRTHLFGHQRAWGSLGWGVFALMSGFLVDAMSDGKVMKNYSGLFYTMLVVITFDWLVVLRMQDVHTEASTTILTDIGRLVLQPRVIVFCVWCIVVGLGTSVVGNFLFWHLEEMSESDGTTCEGTSPYIKTIQGLAVGVQTFGGEVPMYIVSGALLKRIGYANAMSLALAGFGLECTLYASLTNIWWVLPIGVLQGAVLGLFVCSMVSYANEISPIGAEATLQGLSSAVYGGIGRTIGGVVAGYGVRTIGVRMMFTWYGCASVGLCVVHVGVHLALNRFSPVEKRADAIAEVTEDMLSAHTAEQRDEINMKHKYASN